MIPATVTVKAKAKDLNKLVNFSLLLLLSLYSAIELISQFLYFNDTLFVIPFFCSLEHNMQIKYKKLKIFLN